FAGQVPAVGWPALLLKAIATVFFLTARVGFYDMVDARVAAALSPTQRSRFRAAFLVLLALGAIQAFGGTILFVAAGRSDLLTPQAGLVLTASYLVPVAMLFAAYRPAAVAERQRLRWMLVSGVAWVAGIFLQNTPIAGDAPSGILSYLLFTLALLGFLYAVLK